MKLAVVIDVDGDIMYVPDWKVFPNFPKAKVFDNMEDAEEERDKWNTGIIVDLEDDNRTVDPRKMILHLAKPQIRLTPVIRSFDDEERRRAEERARINRDDGTSTNQDTTQ
tara:strand:+ start:319 stop:651 length:333 start_codon:yes stop_codon:yes gene_type:complete